MRNAAVSMYDLENAPQALPSQDADAACSRTLPTRVLILDFSRVTGIDSTAVRSCFTVLDQLCASHDINIVCCGAGADVQYLLKANDLARWSPEKFPTANDALMWAEDVVKSSSQFLHNGPSTSTRPHHGGKHDAAPESSAKESSESQSAVHGKNLARSLLRMARSGNRVSVDEASMINDIERWFTVTKMYEKGESIFEARSPADSLVVVKSGGALVHDYVVATNADNLIIKRGFILGESDFFLGQPRAFSAAASVDGTSLYELTKESFDEMVASHPTLAVLFEKLMLRVLARQVSWANFA